MYSIFHFQFSFHAKIEKWNLKLHFKKVDYRLPMPWLTMLLLHQQLNGIFRLQSTRTEPILCAHFSFGLLAEYVVLISTIVLYMVIL